MILSIKYDSNHNYGINILDYFDNEYIQGAGDKTYKIPTVLNDHIHHYRYKVFYGVHNLYKRVQFYQLVV